MANARDLRHSSSDLDLSHLGASQHLGEPAEVIVHELVTPDSTAILSVMILSDAELAEALRKKV